MADRETVERNSWQVLKYLENWHRIEPGTGTNEQPFDRKHKGTSRPPISDRALVLTKKNEAASAVLSPLLAELERGGKQMGGVAFSDILKTIRQDPGAVRRWRALEGKEWRALRALCRLVARVVASERDAPTEPYEIVVYTDPKDAEADSPRQAAARHREAGRRVSHEEAKLKRARRIRQIQEREGCSENAAIGLWQDETDMSYWTGKRALRFAEGRSTEERPEEGVWRDWGDDNGGGEAA
jgi:hypothetical protein